MGHVVSGGWPGWRRGPGCRFRPASGQKSLACSRRSRAAQHHGMACGAAPACCMNLLSLLLLLHWYCKTGTFCTEGLGSPSPILSLPRSKPKLTRGSLLPNRYCCRYFTSLLLLDHWYYKRVLTWYCFFFCRYFTWDKNYFPNPAGMQQDVASRGRKVRCFALPVAGPHVRRQAAPQTAPPQQLMPAVRVHAEHMLSTC